MTLRVGLCFGKMGSLHDGLAEFSLSLGDELARRSAELRERLGMELTFRLPLALHGRYEGSVSCVAPSRWHRLACVMPQRHDLWHTLHQHNPFVPPAFTRRRLVTVHDLNYLYGNDAKASSKGERRMRRILRRNDALVTISEHVRGDVLRTFAPTQPVQVVHNGVRDLSSQAGQRPEGLPDGPFLFHLSRMAPLKNVPALLGMMAHLPARRLVLAGPRSGDTDTVRAAVAARGLANVTVLVDIDEATKVWLFRHCEAFLFPSLSEGFGLPPIEAMYFGKPVFLSRLTSLPEIGGSVAAYWDDFAPEAMASLLLERLPAMQRPDWTDRLRVHAAQFTWTAAAQRYLDLYTQLLQRETAA